MSLLGWIILGALSGWIASKLTNNDKKMGAVANIVVGVIGAFIGGLIFSILGGSGVTGFNLWSILVSVVGSVILLSIINGIKKKQ